MKVLVIEDSERLRRALEAGLKRSGFAVDLAPDGEAGLAAARLGRHDVVVLDLMLPCMDGLTVLKRLRQEGSKAHVLIVSARDQVLERIQGLQAGADDYLTKPFAFDELVARIQALGRRKFGAKSPEQAFGPFQVDLARRSVRRGERRVDLTPHEFAVLERLLLRRGAVVSKGELLETLYAGDARGTENAVEVFVHQLRRKLEAAGGSDLILTRRGHGYLVE